MAFGVALAFYGLIYFQYKTESQHPPPRAAKGAEQQQSQPTETNKNAKKGKHGTEGNPIAVRILPPQDKAQAPEKNARHENEYASSEWWLVYVTIALTAFTGGLMAYTGGLWWTTKNLMDAAEQTAHTIERAYVQLSHLPPGVDRGKRPSPEPFVRMKIENCGPTPARVTATNITFTSDVASTEPSYAAPRTKKQHNAFLVKGGEVFFMVEVPELFAIGVEFCLLGYVDYIDAFNQRHRTGYARRYDPRLDDPNIYSEDWFEKRNNLVYVGGAKYNYDRPRTKGEGDDWGEKFNA
jgi:hypothetical protein